MNKCKWAQGDFEETCVNADCPMCADLCPVLVQPGVCRYEDRGKRTYGDKIRAMKDEQIAEFLCAFGCRDCPNLQDDKCNGDGNAWLYLLKQEVEE